MSNYHMMECLCDVIIELEKRKFGYNPKRLQFRSHIMANKVCYLTKDYPSMNEYTFKKVRTIIELMLEREINNE